MELTYALLATFGVSLVSLVGITLAATTLREHLELRLVSFAAGVLLATTFLELLPEAIHESDGNTDIFIASLAAMVTFFFIERLLHGFHRHQGHESHVRHHSSSGQLILIGDGVHNFVDGVAIGAAFLVDSTLGVATTVAVLAHEIPHEFADYGILVQSGFSRGRALFYNFLSGLTSVLGAASVFLLGDFAEDNIAVLLAASAGMFIYIAAANLIPELHHQRVKARFVYGTPFVAGIALIAVLTQLLFGDH